MNEYDYEAVLVISWFLAVCKSNSANSPFHVGCKIQSEASPLHWLDLYQNLTNNASPHLVHSIDQQCMKLESTLLHTTTQQLSGEKRKEKQATVHLSYPQITYSASQMFGHTFTST